MSGYHATFSGFRDATDHPPADAKVMFRVWQGSDFASFTSESGNATITVLALLFNERTHEGTVEWTSDRDIEDPRSCSESSLDSLPDYWPEDLRAFMVEHVAAVAAHERAQS